jgi:hypothetical protein
VLAGLRLGLLAQLAGEIGELVQGGIDVHKREHDDLKRQVLLNLSPQHGS